MYVCNGFIWSHIVNVDETMPAFKTICSINGSTYVNLELARESYRGVVTCMMIEQTINISHTMHHLQFLSLATNNRLLILVEIVLIRKVIYNGGNNLSLISKR
jgi:hypothetical protein